MSDLKLVPNVPSDLCLIRAEEWGFFYIKIHRSKIHRIKLRGKSMLIAQRQPSSKNRSIIKVKRRKAVIKIEDGIPWAFCPTCGKKATPLEEETSCSNFPWKCRNTRCYHPDFEIFK